MTKKTVTLVDLLQLVELLRGSEVRLGEEGNELILALAKNNLPSDLDEALEMIEEDWLYLEDQEGEVDSEEEEESEDEDVDAEDEEDFESLEDIEEEEEEENDDEEY
jgi:hypothetical protein